jgi:predicted AAA+ superfamily ATPase
MIQRLQLKYAQDRLFKGKAFIVYGPGQVGKTTFVEQLIQTTDKKVLELDGDDFDTVELLEKPNMSKLKSIIGDNEIICIDEAQRIKDIGIVLKIITDKFKHVQVIATGSSALDLANKVNEPLTGRKYEMLLLPFSYSELVKENGALVEKRSLEQRLVYGGYPEIINKPNQAEEHIKLLANSYLYKDLYTLDQIKKPLLLEKIVKALALQVGSEVKYDEIGNLVKADSKTVEKYIDLLEKTFVIFKLPAYEGNVRNEIKKGKKIYFYDNGIMNAVTGNFNALQNRNDVGALWENYVISERKKYLAFHQSDNASFFWRTTAQQEIDYVEVDNKKILAVEIKWNTHKKIKFPITFTNNYKHVTTVGVTKENLEDFISYH